MASWRLCEEARNKTWWSEGNESDCPSPCHWVGACVQGHCVISQALRAVSSAVSELMNMIASTHQLEHRIRQSWKGLDELNKQSGVDVLVQDVDSLPGDLRARLIESLVPDKAKVTLITANGNRVGLFGSMCDTRIRATATDSHDSERFEVCRLGGGKIALRSLASHGTWVTAQPCDACCGGGDVNKCACFDVYPLGGDRVALRGHHGLFLRAVGGGGGDVVCDSERIGACEVLQVELVGSTEPPGVQSGTWWSDRVRMCAHVHDLHC